MRSSDRDNKRGKAKTSLKTAAALSLSSSSLRSLDAGIIDAEPDTFGTDGCKGERWGWVDMREQKYQPTIQLSAYSTHMSMKSPNPPPTTASLILLPTATFSRCRSSCNRSNLLDPADDERLWL